MTAGTLGGSDPGGGPFRPFLEAQGVAFLDGGLGTTLAEAGCALRPPLWSASLLIDDPDALRRTHLRFLESGADCIASATYQASVRGWERVDSNRREAEAAMRLGVELARDAVAEFWDEPTNRFGRVRPIVAASIGPYGAVLADGSEYDGRYGLSVSELVDFHAPRLQVLVDAGADVLAFETIPSIAETEAIVRLLQTLPEEPAWVSFTSGDGSTLPDGHSLAGAAELTREAPGVVAVGVNCVPPERVAAALEAMKGVVTGPLMAYPNSGQSFDVPSGRWTGSGPGDAWPSHATGWLRAGARIVGGCCRVGPGLLARLRREILGDLRGEAR